MGYLANLLEIGGVSAFEILAYRIVLSMIFMILMIVVLKKSQTFKRDLKHLFSHPIELIVIIIAGYVITINWGTFIWLCQMDTYFNLV